MKQKAKKTISYLLVFAILLITAACGGYSAIAQVMEPTDLKTAAFSEKYEPSELFAMAKRTQNDYSALDNDEARLVLDSFTVALEEVYCGKFTANDSFSKDVSNYFLQREKYAKSYSAACNQTFCDAVVSLSVTSVVTVKNVLVLDVYEWTLIKYMQSGVYDVSGYGFNHTIKIENGKIVSDVVLNDSFTPSNGENQAGVSENTSVAKSGAKSLIQSRATSTTYSADKAVSYADKYALSYNNSYKNMNSIGGDCCNFLSQCLLAGGYKMSDGWYYNSSSDFSASWSWVPSSIEYFSKFGTFIKNPAPSAVLKGNPVYYYSSATSTGAHASICVGKNAAGTPIINAHNNDRYHVDWQLGGKAYFPGGNSTVQLKANIPQTTYVPPTTIESILAGDANSDGKVDLKDMLTIKKYVVKMNPVINNYLADVDADYEVTLKDMLIIKKYIVGIITKLYLSDEITETNKII